MPSIRKRIGYLPSINAQKTISKIANKEKLSQSKVVGILVEEALMARIGFDGFFITLPTWMWFYLSMKKKDTDKKQI